MPPGHQIYSTKLYKNDSTMFIDYHGNTHHYAPLRGLLYLSLHDADLPVVGLDLLQQAFPLLLGRASLPLLCQQTVSLALIWNCNLFFALLRVS